MGNYTQERLAVIRQLHEEGLPQTKIAERLGVSQATVWRYLQKEVVSCNG